MPCNLSTICYIDQYNEKFTQTNITVNAIGISFSRHQNINIFIHITAFYPKGSKNNEYDLENFKKGDIIHLQGRFLITDVDVEDNTIKIVKLTASNVCVLNLEEEDLPKASISVVLIGTVKDDVETDDKKLSFGFTAKEYLDKKNSESLEFNLYHFKDEAYLVPITVKVTRGTPLYITGFLSFVENLLLVKVTQINFIDSASPLSLKSNFAWEKKMVETSSASSTTTEVAKSISMNTRSKQRSKRKAASLLPGTQKIPKLASLSLTPASTSQNENNPSQPPSSNGEIIE